MAASQNALHGTVPECIMELSLEWLWLEDNRVHGPISEYSLLGQYLKNVDTLNLRQNRWAPLLRTEKVALKAVAKPLGVTAAEQDWLGHDWDFQFYYEWRWADMSAGRGLTAERQVTYRRWSAGVPVKGFLFSLPFPLPRRGLAVDTVCVGRDGDMAVAAGNLFDKTVPSNKWDLTWFDPSSTPPWTGYSWDMSAKFCDDLGMSIWPYAAICPHGPGMPNDDLVDRISSNGHDLRQWVPVADQIDGMLMGSTGGIYRPCYKGPHANNVKTDHPLPPPGKRFYHMGQVYVRQEDHLHYVACCPTLLTSLEVETQERPESAHTSLKCWESLTALVPSVHIISEATDAATSSQGADYLSERFCPGWANFIVPAACDPAEHSCSGDDASGSVIVDGGGDM
jgi:hypothetical protein